MAMQRRSFITLNSEKDWRRGLMIGLTVENDRLVMSDSASVSRGLFYSASIDSGETDFEWDRLIVQADIPPDTLFRVSAFASNGRSFEDAASVDDYLKDPYVPAVVKASRLDGLFTESCSGMQDLLLQCRGRYLWLKFELVATGAKKPSIDSVRLQYTGDHMIDYLPAIYRKGGKDSFTRRFLSIFNSLVLDMEEAIYGAANRFDFELVDGDMLRYIASWVCVDTENQSDEEIRRNIARAAEEYRFAQTPEGIRRLIKRWTGRDPILLEHFRVEDVIRRGKDKDLYVKLYGKEPYKFFILLDEKTFKNRREADAFLKRLQKVLPAYVEAELILLSNCVYLDYHTYLGINSVIGSYTPMVIDDSTAIHYDTIIGGEIN